MTVRGRVIASSPLDSGAHGCQAAARNFAVRPGGAVVVSSPRDHPVATGRLGPGVPDKIGDCVLPFTVQGVPADEAMYWLTVGDRPAQGYSRGSLDGPITVDLFSSSPARTNVEPTSMVVPDDFVAVR